MNLPQDMDKLELLMTSLQSAIESFESAAKFAKTKAGKAKKAT